VTRAESGRPYLFVVSVAYRVPIITKDTSMTGKTSPVRRKRRPQRSNSLKDIGRLLGVADNAHVDRKDKLLAQASTLNDTEGAARSNFWKIQRLNLFARELGFQIVANDRAFHFIEERPGAVGQALLDDGPVGQALRHLRALSLDEGAPAPLARQGAREKRSARLGGPLPHAKKAATDTKRKVNEAIVALREADPAFLAACEEQERLLAMSRALTRQLWESSDRVESWQELVTSED
jgi:hypothetical protein